MTLKVLRRLRIINGSKIKMDFDGLGERRFCRFLMGG